MAHRLFEGKEHATSYWKYRVSPSAQLIEEVMSFLKKKRGVQPCDLAVDVGCGSGQGTVLLAPHFSSVVGTDISPAQLEVAQEHTTAPNISYRQCQAEELPFADSSVDLVTAMSAFHWFDRPRFLQEAHRILKAKGCLALLNYTMDMELDYGDCSHTLNTVCKEFYAALLPHRNPCLGPCSVALYKQSYSSIPYTEKEWQECMWVKKSMTLSNYMGMIESFSSYQALLKKDPEEASRLSTDITHRLLAVMGVTSPETELVVGVRYFFLLACKPEDKLLIDD
ncbi:putative methyltransferase DDB_G0268948 [Salmo trutta]|uniref:Zgc:162780 n=1 Tax=Salmo trutta TaxID=8032 RepID=A0A673XNY6_SALTR|nr:putative methyltransferase DDB_G0268948 [Salmo trutta]XP_029558133.1 putative methyltransferase DDB_G0268948 [Salmo trutta]